MAKSALPDPMPATERHRQRGLAAFLRLVEGSPQAVGGWGMAEMTIQAGYTPPVEG